jgi:hypothetical protein
MITKNTDGMTSPSGGLKPFMAWIFALAVALVILRAANIAYILHCSQRDGIEYYSGPDTGSNILNSEALFDERPMAPIFRERIVYPFLLGVMRMAGLKYQLLLWLTVPLEIPCVFAMALLGWALTGRKAVAAIGAVLYVLYPNGYQLSAILMPDWLNGQIMLMAIALLMNWAFHGSRWSGWAACLLIPISQMIRPTLFLLIGPLVLLLWKGFFARDRRVINAILCASAVAYPALNLGVNAALYGVPNLLLSSGFQLHHCYVSYVRAIQRNADTPQSMTFLYFDEKHNVQLADPREVATDPYGTNPIRPDFAVQYTSIVKSSEEFLHRNWRLWFQANLDGIRKQMFNPPRFSPIPDPEVMDGFSKIMRVEPADKVQQGIRLYPDLDSLMRKIHLVALIFIFCGVMLTIRKLPIGGTLFYAGCTGIILLACGAAWHDSVRVRLLLDLLYTPILATGFLSIPAWLCFASLSGFAYGPRRFLHFSNAYMVVASIIVLFGAAIALLRISGPRAKA